jgi:O-antigen/teichoic acid export membrane protein
MEAYGLIGFFITLQSIFLLLDMGLSPTVSREVARAGSNKNIGAVANFLHSVALVYWGLAATILAVVLVFAPLIAEHWLNSQEFEPDALRQAIFLMGLVIACRFPHSIYRGALIGAERLVLMNSINMLMVVVSSFGAVLVLAYVDDSIVAFFVWQALCGVALTFLMYRAAWNVILPDGKPGRSRLRFEKESLLEVWRFTAGMTVVSIGSVILLQLDKVIISAMLSLEDYGTYMVAILAGSIFSAFFTPVFNMIYPRMTALVESGDTAALIELYRKGTRALAMVMFPLAMVLGLYSEPFVALWTGDADLARKCAPLILFISIGFSINGVMHFPYALQLAHGRTRIALYNSVTLMIVMVPLMLFMVSRYGVIGGAAAGMIIQFIYLLLGCWLTHRSLLRGTGIRWLTADVGIPLAIALAVGIFMQKTTSIDAADARAALQSSVIAGLAAVLLTLLASPVFYLNTKTATGLDDKPVGK